MRERVRNKIRMEPPTRKQAQDQQRPEPVRTNTILPCRYPDRIPSHVLHPQCRSHFQYVPFLLKYDFACFGDMLVPGIYARSL